MHHQFDRKYEGTNPALPGRREVLGMGVLAAPLLTSTANAPDALVNVGAMESFQCVIASDWCSAGGVAGSVIGGIAETQEVVDLCSTEHQGGCRADWGCGHQSRL